MVQLWLSQLAVCSVVSNRECDRVLIMDFHASRPSTRPASFAIGCRGQWGDGKGVRLASGRTWTCRSYAARISEAMNRWLIIFGVVLIAAGLLWPLLQKIGLGRLPGDIVIERENFRFYFPIVTSLIISVVLSLILWLLKR